MFVVECPTAAGGRRLLGERTITGLTAVSGGWLLSARCTCGAEHAVAVPVLGRQGHGRQGRDRQEPDRQEPGRQEPGRQGGAARAQVVG